MSMTMPSSSSWFRRVMDFSGLQYAVLDDDDGMNMGIEAVLLEAPVYSLPQACEPMDNKSEVYTFNQNQQDSSYYSSKDRETQHAFTLPPSAALAWVQMGQDRLIDNTISMSEMSAPASSSSSSSLSSASRSPIGKSHAFASSAGQGIKVTRTGTVSRSAADLLREMNPRGHILEPRHEPNRFATTITTTTKAARPHTPDAEKAEDEEGCNLHCVHSPTHTRSTDVGTCRPNPASWKMSQNLISGAGSCMTGTGPKLLQDCDVVPVTIKDNHQEQDQEQRDCLDSAEAIVVPTKVGATTQTNLSSSSSSQSRSRNRAAIVSMEGETKWRTTVDPKTGRTYYYHIETRETQWRKPTELATPEERKEMEEKERKQKEFFAAMEANILSSMSQGAYASSGAAVGDESKEAGEAGKDFPALGASDDEDESDDEGIPPIPKPGLIRTISSMEESVLTSLVKRVPSMSDVQSDPLDITVSRDDGGSLSRKMSLRLSDLMRQASGLGKIDENQESLHMSKLGDNDSLHLSKLGDSDSLHLSRLGDTFKGNSSRSLLPEDLFDPMKSMESMGRSMSFSRLLRETPEDGGGNGGSRRGLLGGSSFMNESEFSFGMASDDNLALQELAAVSDAIGAIDDSMTFEKESLLNNTNGLGTLAEEGSEEDATERTDDSHGHETAAPSQTMERGLYRSIGALNIDLSNDESDADKTPQRNLHRSFGTLNVSGVLGEEPSRPQADRPTSDRSNQTGLARPDMTRRNTCGTLYVGTTMSAPDKEANIKCVCGVLRAHIIQSETEADSQEAQFRIFNDLEKDQKPLKTFRPPSVYIPKPPPPSLEEITKFFRAVFNRAQMESDCIIMTLIYVERLIKTTNGALRPRPTNWRSLIFSCMLLSSKVWDDLSMWNADFSQTAPAGIHFSLQRINELELAVLNALNYKVKVPAGEYAKYYFLLRSMLIKSGLGSDDLRTMNPLDVEGAKRLQQVSAQYQVSASRGVIAETQRSKSLGAIDTKGKVGLEHVVKM